MYGNEYLYPIIRKKETRFLSRGIGRGTRGMRLIKQNADHLVMHNPGYTFNMSGIRGMRDDRYVPAEFIVFQIMQTQPDGSYWAKQLVSFPANGKPADSE